MNALTSKQCLLVHVLDAIKKNHNEAHSNFAQHRKQIPSLMNKNIISKMIKFDVIKKTNSLLA